MKYYELDKEEQELLKQVEEGRFTRVKNFEVEKKKAMAAAKNTLNKIKNINLRLSERVVERLKIKAAEEGIPYQTLASSVLHKYANT